MQHEGNKIVLRTRSNYKVLVRLLRFVRVSRLSQRHHEVTRGLIVVWDKLAPSMITQVRGIQFRFVTYIQTSNAVLDEPVTLME